MPSFRGDAQELHPPQGESVLDAKDYSAWKSSLERKLREEGKNEEEIAAEVRGKVIARADRALNDLQIYFDLREKRGISQREKDVPERTEQGMQLAEFQRLAEKKKVALTILANDLRRYDTHEARIQLSKEHERDLKQAISAHRKEIASLKEQMLKEEESSGMLQTLFIKLGLKKEDPEHLARLQDLSNRLHEAEAALDSAYGDNYSLDGQMRDDTRKSNEIWRDYVVPHGSLDALKEKISLQKDELAKIKANTLALEQEMNKDGFPELIPHAHFALTLVDSYPENFDARNREYIVELVNKLIDYGDALKGSA